MAQFKDLVVSGAARIIGTLYAETIVGNLIGKAKNADTATYDVNGSEITSYIKGLSINGRVISYTKGDGSTQSFAVPETQVAIGTESLAGITKLYTSTGNNTDGTINQQVLTELFGSKLGTSETAAAAVKDGENQNIAGTYIKNLEPNGTSVTIVKGDGSTATFTTQDTTYGTGDASVAGLTKLYSTKGSNTDGTMTQDAISAELTSLDNNKAAKSDTVSELSANGTEITLTKADGSTSTVTTQDTTYTNASTASAGLVKLVASTGQSEEDVMTQKAVTDALSNKLEAGDAVSSLSSNGTTVTYTKADGSTATFTTQDTTYGQADSNTLGLVKLATSTGQSTATVMTQKAVTDELGNTLVNSSMSNGEVTFTKGDGSTFSYNIPSASPASSESAGIAKLYNNISESTATDGGATPNAVNNALDTLNTNLTNLISNIFSMEICTDFSDLPNIGTSKVFYLVPTEDPDTNNNYDEYIWISDIDEDTGDDNGYYELFGSCAIDLSQYYTSSEVDTEIENATSNLVSGASSNGTTVTFTKADGSTFSLNTQDTTYSPFGLGTNGLVPGTSAGQGNYVLSGNGWVKKANAAINADSATYATNAGTATHATNANSATNASSASYATNAGTATKATNASSATYATNAGTAVRATNADTATYANKSGSATSATNASSATYATNAGTATYATNAGTATRATNANTATYATNAGTATNATSATYDSSGNHIAAYIKGVNITGRTITFSRGNGTTFSYQTQDNNTTYADLVFATSSANGKHGLVPAPTKAQVNYVLTGGGWVSKVNSAKNADTATYATNAGTATRATNATNAGTATYATSAGTIAGDFNIDCGLES